MPNKRKSMLANFTNTNRSHDAQTQSVDNIFDILL